MTRARDLADSADKDIAGTVTLDDITLSNDITLADNGKAIFGAGSDLQIYHAGNASYISDQGTGNLRIDGTDIQIRSASGANMAAFVAGAEVQLYHNNQKKLDTTSSGVDITGAVTADAVSVNNDAASFSIASADLTRYQRFRRNASNSLILDKYNGSTTTNTAKFDENGDITFFDASGNASFVYDASAGSVFNEQGADRNFRVESDSNANMLFVDAGNNTVNIGASSDVMNSALSKLSVTTAFKTGGSAVYDATLSLVATGGGSTGNRGAAISFTGEDGTSARTLAKIEGMKGNSTSGDHDGSLVFRIRSSGSDMKSQMTMLDYATIVNDDGLNKDFRVESDSDTHALFVDASTNRVGISTSAPPVQFTVGGNDGTAEILLWGNNANSTSSRLIFGGQSPYTNEFIQFRYDSDGNDLFLETDTTFGVGKIVQFDRQYGRVTFNEDSAADADFRVESNSNSNMLLVDASEDRVLVGTSNAAAKFGPAIFQAGSFAIRTLGVSNSATSTGISVNAGGNGMTALVMVNRNTNAGTGTASAVYMLQFYYDGNHTPAVNLVSGSNFINFGKDGSNNLTIQNPGGGNCNATIMVNG